MVVAESCKPSLGTSAAPRKQPATPRRRRTARHIGPRLISLRNRAGPGLFELCPQMLTQLVQVRIGPPVTRLRRIGGQVVQLPLVVERAHPIRLSAKPVG